MCILSISSRSLLPLCDGKKGVASARSASRRPQEVLLGGEGLGGGDYAFQQPKIDSEHSFDVSSCNMMVVQPIAAIHVFSSRLPPPGFNICLFPAARACRHSRVPTPVLTRDPTITVDLPLN
jgi:hypothetical protein